MHCMNPGSPMNQLFFLSFDESFHFESIGPGLLGTELLGNQDASITFDLVLCCMPLNLLKGHDAVPNSVFNLQFFPIS